MGAGHYPDHTMALKSGLIRMSFKKNECAQAYFHQSVFLSYYLKIP